VTELLCKRAEEQVSRSGVIWGMFMGGMSSKEVVAGLWRNFEARYSD